MAILNLTLHAATPEQMDSGVVEAPAEEREEIKHLLVFDTLPSQEDIERRATALALIAKLSGCSAAMIGGAPFLMGELQEALLKRGIEPVYAFSRRESVESLIDGEVVKTSKFVHLGFVRGYYSEGESLAPAGLE